MTTGDSVVFRPGPTGRRAAVPDGPDVWEVVGALTAIRAEDPDLDGDPLLAELGAVTGLGAAQLRTALRYYAAHPDEIDGWPGRPPRPGPGHTPAFVARADPDNVLQDDTFVAAGHRGRRLAGALKAANLRRLGEHRGGRRWMHPWTAGANPAMRAVNARFGFRAVERTHGYELSRGA